MLFNERGSIDNKKSRYKNDICKDNQYETGIPVEPSQDLIEAFKRNDSSLIEFKS